MLTKILFLSAFFFLIIISKFGQPQQSSTNTQQVQLPDDVFASEWQQSETRLLFLKPDEIYDFGLNKVYKIVSITKPTNYYDVIASINNKYVIIVLGTDNIEKSNALMISYDPNNLYSDLQAASQGSNVGTGWLYRKNP